MAESKKKCRQYSIDYLKFGFIPSMLDKTLPMCLLCNKVLSNDAMKPSKLEDHLKRCHPEKTRKELKYFQTLKEKFQKRPTMDSMFAACHVKKRRRWLAGVLQYLTTHSKIR